MTLSPTGIPLSGSGSGVTPSDDRIVRVRAIRACISCRGRKIRCDQVRPSCGSCSRGNIHCEYPSQARRPPRPRQPDAVLVQRLARLESVIEELSAGKANATRQHDFEKGDGGETPTSSQFSGLEADKQNSPKSPAELQDIEAGLGRLLVSGDGKSRYIGPNFWASLSEEAADLNSLLHETQEDELLEPELDPASGPLSFYFRSSNACEDLSMFHLSPEYSQLLYRRFLVSVDPLIRILHKPSFERQLDLFHRHGLDPTIGLDKGFEAMVFSIYFAAITSMPQDQVFQIFGVDRKTMQGKYMIAVEQALANARFLQSEELMPLQACILFITCLRGGKDTRTCWALVGMVVRIAQSLGLHRDGSLFGMSPFETEMRRRIWYEVCVLDVRTAEDHGCSPSITTISYDTQTPLNINDDDLSEDPNAPAPVSRSEFTEMSFCLLRYEVLDCFRFLFRSEPGTSKDPNNQPITLHEKEEKIEETKKKINEKYLTRIDMTQPLQRVSYVVAGLMMGKALLSLYHPLRHFKDGEFLSHEMKEKLFLTATECLEYGCAFAKESESKGYNQWNWFFQKHGQAHALTLVLLELNQRPIFDEDGLFERAWSAVHAYFERDLWAMGKWVGIGDVGIWKPLRKLRDKALKRKMNAMNASIKSEDFNDVSGTTLENNQELPLDPAMMVMEDSPIDWNEWDDMFRYDNYNGFRVEDQRGLFF